MEIVRIGLERLRGHRLSVNVMRAEVKAKLRRHMERTGRYEPLVVRVHPEEAGAYEILNGHQRAEVLRELGYGEAECVVWEADEGEAEMLLATLNRLRGGDEPGRRAELLERLGRRYERGVLLGMVPERREQMERLAGLRKAAKVKAPAERGWPEAMTFFVTGEQKRAIEAALRAARKEAGGTMGRGEVLARIVGEKQRSKIKNKKNTNQI